jgi:hypothetical protein
MNISYRIDDNIVYIAIEGRIDATKTAIAEEKNSNLFLLKDRRGCYGV